VPTTPVPSILFRADASPVIGSGHVMRCLALARALAKKGANITFATRAYPGNKIEAIKSAGFSLITLPNNPDFSPQPENYRTWLGAGQAEDLEKSLSDQPWDWIVLDHYGADAEWQKSARATGAKLLVIDDDVHPAIDAEAILNTNLGASDQHYKSLSPNSLNLLGPQFALIGEHIKKYRPSAHPRKTIHHILISLGGYDHEGHCLAIARNLNPEYRLTILAGNDNPKWSELTSLAQSPGRTISLHALVQDIGAVISEADFCIGAGGSSNWERCCLGLPSALFSMAENQDKIVDSLGKAGVGIALGRAGSFDYSSLQGRINEIERNNMLPLFSQNALNLVDGEGIDRVLKQVFKLE
jgi:UDP-2,4-diacetamido-2,4,6-trideoxy-beta-L-altropyranose hydrolase